MAVFIEDGVHDHWAERFVVIDESGTLMVFEDESMGTMKMSFILGKLTLNNFTFVAPKPDFPLIRVEIKGQSQRMLFLFETAGEHREFMQFVLRYIDVGDHNEKEKFTGNPLGKVYGQHLNFKIGGKQTPWNTAFVVVDNNGTLKLFEDENMEKPMGSFALNQWSSDDIIVSKFSVSGSLRLSMVSAKGNIHFGFESESKRYELLNAIKYYVNGQRVEFLGEHGHLFLTENNILQRFTDETKMTLKVEVALKNVNLGSVLAVGQRAFIVVEHGATEPVLFWTKNEEERDLWIEILRKRIEIMNQIDFNLFEHTKNEEEVENEKVSKGSGTPSVRRIVQCLDLFAALNSASTLIPQGHGDGPDRVLTAFCNEHYSQTALLEDYVEFMDNHSDPQSVRDIAGRLQVRCDGVRRCSGTQRHFRERGDSKEDVDDEDGNNYYVETLDSLHFFLCHLEEMGLRVPAELLQSAMEAVDGKQTEQSLVDAVSKRMALEIAARLKVRTVNRFDGANNTKFNISMKEKRVEAMNATATANSNTVRDEMELKMFEDVAEYPVSRRVHKMLEAEDMDTDCIENEMQIYEEDGDCNLLKATKYQMNAFDALRSCMRRHRVCAKALSVGKPLYYWEWHRKVSDKEIKKDFKFRNIKWDGHSIKDLLVYPHFDCIKTEALQSGLVTAAEFEKGVVQKAERYLKMKKCRKMKARKDGNTKSDYYFGIEMGSGLRPEHSHALFLYTDFTKFCTEFSRSFRETSDSVSTEDVVANNSNYFYTAKALREIVTLFGSSGRDDKEYGPFYCGLNCVLNIPQFAISFQCPTSTTKTKEIAIRFAGESGMMMVMNNKGPYIECERFLNAQWLSCYPEEDERLFVGSTYHLKVESVLLIQSAKNYRLSFGAFAKLDQALNGRAVEEDVTPKEQGIIIGAMESVKGRGTVLKRCQFLDQFAVDNFYLMTLQKTKIILHLFWINNMKSEWMKELLVYSTSSDHEVEGPNDTTNVVKADLLALFTNLSTVTITDAYRFPFSVSRLLDELSTVESPVSLSTISIMEGKKEWVQKEVDSALRQKAAAMDMTVEIGVEYGNPNYLKQDIKFLLNQ